MAATVPSGKSGQNEDVVLQTRVDSWNLLNTSVEMAILAAFLRRRGLLFFAATTGAVSMRLLERETFFATQGDEH